MDIRHATTSDANAIAEVHVATWRDAYRGHMPDAILDALDVSQRADFWHRTLSAEHSVIVATQDSTITGFCSLIASRDEDAVPGSVAEIAALYVRSRHWRCGVARALCSHVFEAAASAGYSSITLWVIASNSRAIDFYTAVGFAHDGSTKTERIQSGFVLEELRMRRAIQLPAYRKAS
jgi:ribosomal protein S18 acetylase RimI-like enzyme